MRLVVAKCPSCGASIEVQSDSETRRCKPCGSAILVEDAIQKFKIEVSGQVSMSGLSTVDNDIGRAKQYLDAEDCQTAFKTYSLAVNKQANNYGAWLGCLLSMTQNFSWIDRTWVNLEGISGIKSVIINAFNFASREQKPKLIYQMNDMLNHMEQHICLKYKFMNNKKRRQQAFQIMFLLASIVAFLVSIGMLVLFPDLFSLGIVLFLLSVLTAIIVSIILYLEYVPSSNYLDSTTLRYVNEIRILISDLSRHR